MWRSAVNTLTDREKTKQWVAQHRGSLQAWGAFAIVVFLIFFVFSDGDFSFLLTLSSIVSMFSFIMVIYKIESSKSAHGLSLVMMQCYVVLLIARLFSIIPFDGYLPYDKSGDWLYQLTEAISCTLAGTIVFVSLYRYRSTCSIASDGVKQYWLIFPALGLALVFHPSLISFMPADIAWTFALYLESICCFPQLLLFQKEGKVEPFTTHFLAGQALSKLVSFIFWFVSFSELNDPTRKLKSYVGVWVVVMQLVQLIVMCDFIYHYVRCLTTGVPIECIFVENV